MLITEAEQAAKKAACAPNAVVGEIVCLDGPAGAQMQVRLREGRRSR